MLASERIRINIAHPRQFSNVTTPSSNEPINQLSSRKRDDVVGKGVPDARTATVSTHRSDRADWRASVGQALGKRRASIGQASDGHRTGIGQASDKRLAAEGRAETGQRMGGDRSHIRDGAAASRSV